LIAILGLRCAVRIIAGDRSPLHFHQATKSPGVKPGLFIW
jgi:hypothetical protein